MARSYKLVEHASTEELERLYRGESEGVKRSHLQIVWLAAQKKKMIDIAAMTGYGASWISQIIKRYNARGLAGLGDKRLELTGPALRLNEADQQKLAASVVEGRIAGQPVSAARVKAWVEQHCQKQLSEETARRYLHLIGFSRQIPRPRHERANAEAQEGFKKKNWQRQSHR